LSHLDLAGVAPGSGLALVVERLVTTVHGRVAEPVDLSVRGGQLVAVRGESGAGKSVLLRTLAGLSPAVSGTVLVAGRAPAPYERSGRAALRLVENDPPPLPIPVAELCVAAAVELAVEWCVALGLAAPDPGAPVGTLEPAQRQVVALAAACAAGPAVLLVDETTSALDPAGERALLTLIRDRLPDTAIVAVLHRPDNVDLADAEVLVSTAVNGPPAADVSRADSMPGRANGRRTTSMPGAPTSVPGLPACGLRGKGHTGRV
jgi:ABC-type multidrug transport system ATPase subunit